MTLITTSSIIGMIASIAGYWCYENDYPVPVLWTVGSFWADWWFHDFSRTPYNHIPRGDYTQDGQPFVWKFEPQYTTTEWPYSYFEGDGGITAIPEATTTNIATGTTNLKKGDSKTGYTPIKGLYGVDVRDPRAMWPNDYIAKRLLGEWATATDLTEIGATAGKHSTIKMPYNPRVFTAGVSPFTAQEIGPNDSNNPDWENMDKYTVPTNNGNYVFLPPLFSTTETISPPKSVGWPNSASPPYNYPLYNVRSYSGAESYDSAWSYGYDPIATTEGNVLPHLRPNWYFQDQFGNSTYNDGTPNQIGVWPGLTKSTIGTQPSGGYNVGASPSGDWIMRPEFGITMSSVAVPNIPNAVDVLAFPWGANNPANFADTVVSTNGGTADFLPTEVQASYIQNMLFTINSNT